MSKSVRISDQMFALLEEVALPERRSVSAEAQLRLERSFADALPPNVVFARATDMGEIKKIALPAESAAEAAAAMTALTEPGGRESPSTPDQGDAGVAASPGSVSAKPKGCWEHRDNPKSYCIHCQAEKERT